MSTSEGPRQKLCADAHYNKDLAKYNLKDYYGAITDYTIAIELNPDYAAPKYSHKKYEEDGWDVEFQLVEKRRLLFLWSREAAIITFSRTNKGSLYFVNLCEESFFTL